MATILAAGSDRLGAHELRLPSAQGGWSGPIDLPDGEWHPVFLGTHDERRGTYRDAAGHSVEALGVGYAAQVRDRQLVNEGNSLVGDGGLTLLEAGRTTAGGTSYREDIVTDSKGQRSVIWSFYVIGDRSFATPLWARLWYGISAWGAPTYSTLFAFRTACVRSCVSSRAVLSEFLLVMRPQLLVVVRRSQTQRQEVLAGP